MKNKTFFCANASDGEMLLKSSSGGMFGVLANKVLEKGGYVCGCVYDESMKATHILTNEAQSVQSMYGSKYVQSQCYACYPQVLSRLEEGTPVLFSGTACQIAALRKFLKRDYDTLCTVEILCHGVPSPAFFAAFVAHLNKKLNGKVIDIQFRNKEKDGWGSEHKTCVIYQDKKGILKKYRPKLPSYFSSFFYGLSLRESCYQCHFARNERVADITLGDFWGAWAKYRRRFDEGISVVAVNSDRGRQMITEIKDCFAFYEELERDVAMKSNDNFYHPVRRPRERTNFYRQRKKGTYRGFWKKTYFAKTYRKKVLASIYGAFVPKKIRYAMHGAKKKQS